MKSVIASTRAAQSEQPALVCEIELSQRIPVLDGTRRDAGPYRRAVVLVRLHTRPIGRVELPLGEDGRLDAATCARQVWSALRGEIAAHLAEDGLPAVARIDAEGLPAAASPRCSLEREELLARAPWVTVVVATHNRPESLRTCLQSLMALDYPAYDVVVVDNAPSDDSAAQVVAQICEDGSRVRYVREPRPGLACAHNRGMLEVRAPFVAFTDDDVHVDRHWLSELVRGFGAARQVGCVTGLIWPAELDTPAQVWIENSIGFNKGFARKLFDLGEHRGPGALFPYTAGAFGSGANMAFRSDVLLALRGFDPALGAGSAAMGGDDLAAFFGVIAGGSTLVYEPGAIVHHRHHREYSALQRQAYGYGVGLTAYLASALAEQPHRLLDFAGRLPSGLAYAFGAQSPMNARKGGSYAGELKGIGRRGMLYGPFAYLKSRWRYRRVPRLQGALGDVAGGYVSPAVAQERLQ